MNALQTLQFHSTLLWLTYNKQQKVRLRKLLVLQMLYPSLSRKQSSLNHRTDLLKTWSAVQCDWPVGISCIDTLKTSRGYWFWPACRKLLDWNRNWKLCSSVSQSQSGTEISEGNVVCARVAHSSRDADGRVHGTTWIWWSGWACDQLHSLARLARWTSAWWYLIERVSHCAGRIYSCIPSKWDSASCKGLRSITEYSYVKLYQTKEQHTWARQLNPLCFFFRNISALIIQFRITDHSEYLRYLTICWAIAF